MRTIEAQAAAAGLRVAVVVSKYNDFVTDRLQTGALQPSGNTYQALQNGIHPRQAKAFIGDIWLRLNWKKLHIEGEVLLEVVFESSGKLHVVRVVRGLGHGLDEAAIQAAEQIHFKPALHDGQPADSNAVLHILFQLT